MKEPGLFTRWWWKRKPPAPRKGEKFSKDKYIPSKVIESEGKKLLEASSQWKAALSACEGNPNFAFFLAKLYRELKHSLQIAEVKEASYEVKRRVRIAEEQGRFLKPEEELPRVVSRTVITPEQAAEKLLERGALPKQRPRKR